MRFLNALIQEPHEQVCHLVNDLSMTTIIKTVW